MHEYVFKMKKGEIEIELKSDDLEFVEEQLNKWREDLLQKYIDKTIRIPMRSTLRSLNLSNSVAIVIYEVLRQLDYLDLLRVEPHKSENFIVDGIDKHE